MFVTMGPSFLGLSMDDGGLERSSVFGAPEVRVASAPSWEVGSQDDLSVEDSGVGLLRADFCFMSEDSLNVQIDLALSAWGVPRKLVVGSLDQSILLSAPSLCNTMVEPAFWRERARLHVAENACELVRHGVKVELDRCFLLFSFSSVVFGQIFFHFLHFQQSRPLSAKQCLKSWLSWRHI